MSTEIETSNDVETQKADPFTEVLARVLSEHGPLKRSQLVTITETPRTTIYDNLIKLINSKRVTTERMPQDGRGRPFTIFRLL